MIVYWRKWGSGLFCDSWAQARFLESPRPLGCLSTHGIRRGGSWSRVSPEWQPTAVSAHGEAQKAVAGRWQRSQALFDLRDPCSSSRTEDTLPQRSQYPAWGSHPGRDFGTVTKPVYTLSLLPSKCEYIFKHTVTCLRGSLCPNPSLLCICNIFCLH